MLLYTVFFFCFNLLTPNYLVFGQNTEGLPCETPNHNFGTCIELDSCPPLLELLLSLGKSPNPEARRFLRSSACGRSARGKQLVCCSQNLRSMPEETTLPATTVSPQVGKLPSPPNCGFSNRTQPRIVNGIPAKLGEFPWIVALGYRNSLNPSMPKWLCGGSLITNRHIITAAHCVYNRNDLYLARLGDLDLYDDDDGATPTTVSLIKAKIHEKYNRNQFTSDIAILTMKEENTNPTVWPVCLPTLGTFVPENYVGKYPIVAGWGALNFKGPSSSVLQEILIPVIENTNCEKVYKGSALIDERILCAGYAKGGKDACQGDSGGPLVLGKSEADNIRYYQIGVVSYGFRCAEAGYPGVYSRITHFREWIQNNID